jgi:AraC family ethanolamine operon transcriptional activator
MDEPGNNYIRSTRASDILDLKRIARGINMDIVQLDEGSFESDVIQLKVRNVLASRITSNQRLRLQGTVRFLAISFISEGTGLPSWRGVPVCPTDVLAVNADDTFDLIVPPGVEAYCVSVLSNVEATLRCLGGPVFARKLSDTAHPIPCDPDAIRETRAWLEEQFNELGRDSDISNSLALELEQEFLRRLAVCLRAGRPSCDRASTASGRTDVVRRVEQHLLDDLALPQTVDDLCRVARTSRRTLEYAFRDYFGTSPKRFIKALRLNAARNDLVRGSHGSAQVVEIASGWGFTHMGQFSADYRQMFGEKPSETLRRSSRSPNV